MKNLIRIGVVLLGLAASTVHGRQFTGGVASVTDGNLYISLYAYRYTQDLVLEVLDESDNVVASAYIWSDISGSMDEFYNVEGVSGSSNASRWINIYYQPMWWSITGLPTGNYRVRFSEGYETAGPAWTVSSWETYAMIDGFYPYGIGYTFELSY